MEKLYLDALELAVENEEVTCSLLQRKLSIGYPKALKICEWMEQNGYVDKEENYSRKTLITKELLEEIKNK